MLGLAEKKIPDIPAPVGRPPLGKSAEDTKTTIVRFDTVLRGRVDKARGDQPMAAFIREAVERELERRESHHPSKHSQHGKKA